MKYVTAISKTTQPIILDGKMQESAWSTADWCNSFWTKFPYVTPEAKPSIEVALLYDEENMYVAVSGFTD